VKLITFLHLVQRLRMHGAALPIRHTSQWPNINLIGYLKGYSLQLILSLRVTYILNLIKCKIMGHNKYFGMLSYQ
jgi:hypothetical protein